MNPEEITQNKQECTDINDINQNFDNKKSDYLNNFKIPEKFRDPTTSDLNVEALLKSYIELEKILGRRTDEQKSTSELPTDSVHHIVPESYADSLKDTSIELISEVDEELRKAGMNQEQAELVYQLGKQHLEPRLQEIESQHHLQRLKNYFGEQRWERVKKEISEWGEANIESNVYSTLSSTSDGVIALYAMMNTSEPAIFDKPDGTDTVAEEDQLYQLMRDPRYWRDHDPEIVEQVTRGFQHLYGGSVHR